MKNVAINSKSSIKITLIYSLFTMLLSMIMYNGIFMDYVFADSCEFIWLADISKTFQHEFIRGGRPLFGLLNQLAFGTLSDAITDLKWLRLFSLLGCVIFSSQIFYFLKSIHFKTIEASLFSFSILALPSFSVYIGWSSTYQVPWGLCLSFFAGVLLIKALKKQSINIGIYIIALILVVISLTLYQTTGTAFLIPFVFKITCDKNLNIKKGIQILFFLGLSFILYYIVFKLNLKYHNVIRLERSEISLVKFPYRFLKFYFRELFLLLKTGGIIIWSKSLLALGLVTFLGFLYVMYNHVLKNKKYIAALFIITAAPLTYIPNLLSSGNYLSHRAIGPAAVIIFFYQFYFIKHTCGIIKHFKIVAIAGVLIVNALAYVNLNTYICDIQNKEYVILKKTMNNIEITPNENLVFIIPEFNFLTNERFYEKSISDEFIQTSCSRLWYSSPFFMQNLKETRHRKSSEIESYNIQIIRHGEHFEKPEDGMIINLRDVLIEGFSNYKQTNTD